MLTVSTVEGKSVTMKQTCSQTRKPCYRKGDRAMRPIYGCSENFCGSLTMPTATFADMLNALFLIDPVNLHTKFEVHTFMDNTWIRQRWVLG